MVKFYLNSYAEVATLLFKTLFLFIFLDTKLKIIYPTTTLEQVTFNIIEVFLKVVPL